MAQPMSAASPAFHTPPVARSNSITSTNSASSAASLKRRSRTRTRTLTRDARRGVSLAESRRASPSRPAPVRLLSVPPYSLLTLPLAVTRHQPDDSQTVGLSQPDIPPVPTRFPQPSAEPSSSSRPDADVQVLTAPPRRERAWSTVHIRDVPPRGRGSKSDSGPASKVRPFKNDRVADPFNSIQAKARARGMSLPRSAFRQTTASSDESSVASPRTPTGPFEPPFVSARNGNSQHFRDSVVSSSTSLYPPSTSTDSDIDSSSPARSFKKRGHDFGPDVMVHNGQTDFDVDDVSYRLRLLVNNSYFLPPAHLKPSPLSLAPPKPPADQKPAKAPAPAFLDFFRMGKSKSKPSSPLAQTPPVTETATLGPVLRTTSDSTTAGGYVTRPQNLSSPQVATKQSFSAFQPPPPSRVVVLRERMDDLMEAAKQVERDMKLRDGRKAKSQGTVQAKTSFDDVIDPTDIVDLPPPPAAYPFAVQTSALHGLGPGESLGADLLADRLPPSPGMWSMSTEEASWRKAILHEAVSLSLTESPETSFSSISPAPHLQDSELPSFRSENGDNSPEPASPPTPKATPLIGQRIVEPSRLESEREEARTLSPLSALYTLQPTSPLLATATASTSEGTRTPWSNAAGLFPRRAETPAATLPLTPPPPRKHLSHPQLSMSVSEVRRPPTTDPEPGRESINTLRKAVSSPRLSAINLDHRDAMSPTPPVDSITQRLGMLSPPVPEYSVSNRPSLISLRGATPFSDDDDLSYVTPMDGDIDEDQPRPSMTLSIPTIGRASMSECSNASPTVSAFEDAVFGSCRSPSPLLFRRSHAGSIGASSGPSPTSAARPNVMSPPPRPSSSVEATILPPPPRIPAVRPVYRPSTSSGRSSQSTEPLHTAAEGSASEADPEFSPSTAIQQLNSPTLSLSARRGRQSGLSLLIPPEIITPAIHSAPAPASPTAFFDRIQSQHNAMDDLETSDESDAESMAEPALVRPPQPQPPYSPHGGAFGDTSMLPPPRSPCSVRNSVASSRSSRSTRPSFMRLGNHSTPHLTPSSMLDEPSEVLNRRLPVGHIADKDAVSVRSWKKGGKTTPALPLPRRDSDTSAHRAIPRVPISRPATSGEAEDSSRRMQRESLQKFEGLLLDHIASERDTIKRITNNISSSSTRQGS